MKKEFTEEELVVIGRKIRMTLGKLRAQGFKPSFRNIQLFRGQIAGMVGVTDEEMTAYSLHLVQKRSEGSAGEEINAVGLDRITARTVRWDDGRLRRLIHRIRLLFRSTKFA